MDETIAVGLLREAGARVKIETKEVFLLDSKLTTLQNEALNYLMDSRGYSFDFRFGDIAVRVQPRAIVLEYRLNGQDRVERIPILPGQDADRVAREKILEYTAVSSFTVREIY